MLANMHNKKYRKIFEASNISNNNTLKEKLGGVDLSSYIVKFRPQSYVP